MGFLQSLVAEPPITVFQQRQQHLATYSNNFGPLTPASWSATSLAYLKEMEVLTTRKSETQKKPKSEPKEDLDPSPKRKARFPKKPKGEGGHRVKSYACMRGKGRHKQAVPRLDEFNSRNGKRTILSTKDFDGGPDSPTFILSHTKWCAMLTALVLRSRTPFAAYFSKSLAPPQGPSGSAPTVFPLPAPFKQSPFERMPPFWSKERRRKIHRRRALHIMVMALNYWHSGGDFSELKWIGRPQTSAHRSIYGRLKALLLSDVLTPDFSMVRAGRKFPQLLARLSEVSDYVTQHGVASQPYTKTFEGVELQRQQDLLPGLEPYKKADPSRFQIEWKRPLGCDGFPSGWSLYGIPGACSHPQ